MKIFYSCMSNPSADDGVELGRRRPIYPGSASGEAAGERGSPRPYQPAGARTVAGAAAKRVRSRKDGCGRGEEEQEWRRRFSSGSM